MIPQYQPLAVRREVLSWVRSRFTTFVEPSVIAGRFNLPQMPAFTGTALHLTLVGVEVECLEAEVLGGLINNDRLTILVAMPVKSAGPAKTAIEKHITNAEQLRLVIKEG